MTNKKEKRRASRILVPLPAKYKIIGKSPARWAYVSCNDICGLGFGLIVKEPLKVNERLKVSISRKEDNKTMSANCRVAWRVKDAPGVFRVGVEIAKVDDPLPFIEFIGDMLLSMRKSSITVCRKRRKTG